MKHLLKSFWRSLFIDNSLKEDGGIIIQNPQNVEIINNSEPSSLDEENPIADTPNTDFKISPSVNDKLNTLNPPELLDPRNDYYEDDPSENDKIEDVISQLDNPEIAQENPEEIAQNPEIPENVDQNEEEQYDNAPLINPITGEPIEPDQNDLNNQDSSEIPLAQAPEIDPNSGSPVEQNAPEEQPIEQNNEPPVDPNIGANLAEPPQIDPNSGSPMEQNIPEQMPQPSPELPPENNIPSEVPLAAAPQIDPNSGNPVEQNVPQNEPIPMAQNIPLNQEIPLAQPPQIDPNTGQPLDLQQSAPPQVDPNAPPMPQMGAPVPIDPNAAQNPQMDPNSGMPLGAPPSPNVPPQIDPSTGQPLAPPPAMPPQIDPNTGQPLPPAPPQIDPATGQPIPPAPGLNVPPQIDPNTGQPIPQPPQANPQTTTLGNITDSLKGPAIPLDDLSRINELKKVNTRLTTMEQLLNDRSNREYKKIGENIKDSLEYFKYIITNLDSFIQYNTDVENKYALIDELILKFKRFIYITLIEIKNIDSAIINQNQDENPKLDIKNEKNLYTSKQGSI